jgi:3-methylcrotonyl-CoA carboxylase alpha subunit
MADTALAGTPRRIGRVLIANRGEIAVRIARTCNQMVISTVAVYSEADARALHVLVADKAICIGPPPPLQSYLNIDAILAAAHASGADAVHPGYGFLAENPRFAEAIEAAGLVWIGPPPRVIALLGDKVASKELAQRSRLQTVPGYMGKDQRPAALAHAAHQIGYPVLLKAAAGGGGRGMRSVSRQEDLVDALESARREARTAFGNDRIFMEHLLARPRHVEVQVLLDAQGHGVYLGDRDCSLQRRHQKVIEEAPAPGLTPELHAAMGADAVRLAQAAGYVNAGTVEFLLDGDEYYFLEMNTRIQVEHPVTEMVTGLDLVRLQIEIAGGAELPFGQKDVTVNGHSIEARIYAEDPKHDFLPSTGTLRAFRPFAKWPDVRNDVGVYRGFEVTPYYDPLLAKTAVWAPHRDEAIEALVHALAWYEIEGPVTNLEFLQWAASSPEFRRGEADIAYVDREWQGDLSAEPPVTALAAAAAFELVGHGAGKDFESKPNPWQRTDGWRQRGMPRYLAYRYGGRTFEVCAVAEAENTWRLTVQDREVVVGSLPDASRKVFVSDESVRRQLAPVEVDGALQVTWDGLTYIIQRGAEHSGGATHSGAATDDGPTAPMPGTVVKVAVQPGQRVTAHEPLVVLEAMKMEHVVEAPYDGVVTTVLVKEGELVPAGSPVVILDEE